MVTPLAHAGFAVTEPGQTTTAKDGTARLQRRMLVELAGMGPKVGFHDVESLCNLRSNVSCLACTELAQILG